MCSGAYGSEETICRHRPSMCFMDYRSVPWHHNAILISLIAKAGQTGEKEWRGYKCRF
jgi:hypothetical protein